MPLNTINRCLYINSFHAFIEEDRMSILGALHDNFHGEALTTTNDAWIEEITSLLKNIFEYAKEKEFIKYNPLEKINLELEHLPEMELDNKQIKDIRNVFAKYGFRRDQRRKVVKEIFFIHYEKN